MFSNILGLDHRVALFRELATMVNSGISLSEAISLLKTRPAGPNLRAAMEDAEKRIARGEQLSEVMADHPDVFSELNRAMVMAGEQSGRLDETLNDVADYLEKEQELRQMLSRETFYPKVLIGAMIVIPLITQVVIAAIGSGAGAAVLTLLKQLAFYAAVGGFFVALWYVYNNIRSTEQGGRTIDELKLKIPVFGPLILQLAWAKICRAVGALYKAGLTMDQATEIAAGTAGNRVIAQQLQNAVPIIQKGKPLSEALVQQGNVPDLPLRMLQSGEKTGDIDVTMEKVATYFEARAETSIRKLSILIMPISVVLLGIVVLIMAMQFYGGYFSSTFDTLFGTLDAGQ
ncbi:MAG: type II secretion system F family protein [Armatimonadota bacterium]